MQPPQSPETLNSRNQLPEQRTPPAIAALVDLKHRLARSSGKAGVRSIRWVWAQCLRPNQGLLAVAAAATAAALLVRALGFPVFAFIGLREFYVGLLLSGVLVLPVRLLVTRLQVRDQQGQWIADPVDGWRRTWRRMREDYLNPAAALRAGVALVLLAWCLCLFVGWKGLITRVVPFYLDPALERWDIWLHGGRAPWDWLSVLNTPSITLLLEKVYYFALGIFILSLAYTAWSVHPLRNRLLVGTVVIWFAIGSIGATLLSSAGPVFVAPSFAEQRAYLMSVPGLLSPTAWQDMWSLYQRGIQDPFASISAMPSLHVATPVLLLCAAASRYRWMLLPGVVCVLLTFTSAVYLGWHYALDGYVSILAVLAYWRISGSKAFASPRPAGTSRT